MDGSLSSYFNDNLVRPIERLPAVIHNTPIKNKICSEPPLDSDSAGGSTTGS
jgi:hypothetical protein